MSESQRESAGPPSKKTKSEVQHTDTSKIFTRKQARIQKNYDSAVSSLFNALPNEVIEHLFSFLDRKSLKTSLLVDKRWKEIISSSLKIMKKLPLTILSCPGDEFKDMKMSQRRYRIVEFENIDGKLPQYFKEALFKIGSEVETVMLDSCSFEFKILEVLNCFPKVENIFIGSYPFDDSIKPTVKLYPNMIKNLKILTIIGVSSVIENFIGAHQLAELYVEPVWHDSRYLIYLLSTQTCLKKLQLTNMVEIPDEVELLPLVCQIQELTIIGYWEGMSDDKLQNFVKLFSSSVLHLNIGINLLHESMLPTILDNFKALKSLVLNRITLPSQEFYEEQQTKFASLEYLHIHSGIFENSTKLAGFFSLFPSIKQLRISCCKFDESITAEDIRNVTQRLVTVNTLCLDETFGQMQHAAFKNLEGIHLMSYDAAEKIDWKEIAVNNPTLSFFSIDISNNENQLDLEALTQCSSKEFNLEFKGEFKMTVERLKTIMANAALQMRLKIRKSSLEMSEETFKEILGITGSDICEQ